MVQNTLQIFQIVLNTTSLYDKNTEPSMEQIELWEIVYVSTGAITDELKINRDQCACPQKHSLLFYFSRRMTMGRL